MLDISLVNKYINGEDLDIDTDVLESDSLFMETVIKISRDKNMFQFCSDSLKNNYDFLIKIINIFKDDINFVSSIVEEFLANHFEDDEEYIMLLIYVFNLYRTNENNIHFFDVKLFSFYNNIRIMAESSKLRHTDYQTLSDIGCGFIFIVDNYNSLEIRNYVAKRMLNEILFNSNNLLEEKIHSCFNSFDDLENYGITKFILEVIESKDTFLKSHVEVHIELLKPILQEVDKIKIRWDIYNSRRKYVLAQRFYKKSYDYFDKLNIDLVVGNMIIDKVIRNLNLYDYLDINKEDLCCCESIVGYGFIESRCYNQVVRIANEIFFGKEYNNNLGPSKVLKFPKTEVDL